MDVKNQTLEERHQEILSGMKDRILRDLRETWAELDDRHPQGFPCTRDGIHLGISEAAEELLEAKQEWRKHKRYLDNPESTRDLRAELLQAAADIMIIVSGIDMRHPPR